jgi:hypothetical protein
MAIFKQNIFIRIIFCSLLATAIALTTHIYVLELTKPLLDQMMQDAIAKGINNNPDPFHYGKIIICSAYITAFLTIGVLAFLYYHCQHLIPGRSKFTKFLVATAIIFGVKGELIRQPIMDIILNYTTGFPNPILFVVLNHTDKWLANILLAACLVYLCPKNKSAY